MSVLKQLLSIYGIFAIFYHFSDAMMQPAGGGGGSVLFAQPSALVDSSMAFVNGITNGQMDIQSAYHKWYNGNALGVVCSGINQLKMCEIFDGLCQNLCAKLEDWENSVEAATKSANAMPMLNENAIIEKIDHNSLVNAKNKTNMAKLVHILITAIDNHNAMIKECGGEQQKRNNNSSTTRRRRRRRGHGHNYAHDHGDHDHAHDHGEGEDEDDLEAGESERECEGGSCRRRGGGGSSQKRSCCLSDKAIIIGVVIAFALILLVVCLVIFKPVS